MILITNDDGFYAKGIQALRAGLAEVADVLMVAPESEQSAVGHAITLSSPLRVRKVEKKGELQGYAVNGTPADCVKIAVTELLDEPPELVISGVNQGGNLGTCAIYSGTVSAATEAAIMEVIDGLADELTIIMIAHRLSTVRHADRIYLLDHGKISASGSYDELLDNSATFRTRDV